MRLYSEVGCCSVYYIDQKGQEFGPLDVSLKLHRRFSDVQEYQENIKTFVDNIMGIFFDIPSSRLAYHFEETTIHGLN